MVAGRSLGPLIIQFEDLVLLFFSPHSGHLSAPSEDKHQAGNGELREGVNELTHACLCWSCEQVSSLQQGRRYLHVLAGVSPTDFCYLCNFKDRGFRGRSTKCWRRGMHTRLPFATASSVTRIIWFLRYKGKFTIPSKGSWQPLGKSKCFGRRDTEQGYKRPGDSTGAIESRSWVEGRMWAWHCNSATLESMNVGTFTMKNRQQKSHSGSGASLSIVDKRKTTIQGHPQEMTGQYLRLGLWRVVTQGNILPLDLCETLLTEVIPVSKKAILGWTGPS